MRLLNHDANIRRILEIPGKFRYQYSKVPNSLLMVSERGPSSMRPTIWASILNDLERSITRCAVSGRNSRACCSPRFRLFISHVYHSSAGLATKGHISATIMTVMQLLTAVHRLFYCSLAFPKNGKKPGSSVVFPGSFWGFSSLVSCALGSQMFSASSRFSRERLALSFCARTSAGPRFSSVN